MTEQQWLASNDPAAMLWYLARDSGPYGPYGRLQDQDRFAKLRSWVEACRLLASPTMMSWVFDLKYAEGIEKAAQEWGSDTSTSTYSHLTMSTRASLLRDIVGNPFRPVTFSQTSLVCTCPSGKGGAYSTQEGQLVCLRCGKAANLEWHQWLTSTVRSLAQAAYDERSRPAPSGPFPGIGATTTWVDDGTLDPARLAVLSDALEEAGCDNEDMLRHLRSPGPHVRGCWALDLVLGKE